MISVASPLAPADREAHAETARAKSHELTLADKSYS